MGILYNVIAIFLYKTYIDIAIYKEYNNGILEEVSPILGVPQGGGESMPVSKAQQEATARYEAKVYDKVLVRFPKGRKSEIQTHAEARGESVNGFLNRAAENQMAADNGAQMGAVAAQEGQQAVLPPETIEAARRAAEATGETTPDFIHRAVDTQAQRDANSLRLGINPASGDKLDKEV